MKFLSKLKQKDLKGKIVLVRIDLNILDEDISQNNLRVQSVLPTMKFLIKNGAKVVILSHRGRPNVKSKIKNQKSKLQGKIQNDFSLKIFKNIYERLLKQSVKFVDFFAISRYSKNFSGIAEEIRSSKNNVFLLENLRFFEGEEKNSNILAKQLAELGDLYVNDAFAVSHRANASVAAITKYIPSYAGLLLENEIKNLDVAAKNGKRPFIFILGGSKISDKIGILESFSNKVDYFLTGGGIAINLFMAQGLPIGDSICDPNADLRGLKRRLTRNKNIILPIDVAIDKRKILDIGPETVKMYSDMIKKAKTVAWNGPMGQIEVERFKKGSDGIVKAIMQSKAFTIVGGGETATLFKGKSKIKNGNLFISTGGGAMLEYLSGKKLPGIIALDKNKKKI